jgi:DNA-binding transcriptional LysR family regulator
MAAGMAPRTVLEADSMQAQLGYVACGMGVALVPTSGYWIHTRKVSWVPLIQGLVATELSVVWPVGPIPPLLDYFLGVVREEAFADQHAAIA